MFRVLLAVLLALIGFCAEAQTLGRDDISVDYREALRLGTIVVSSVRNNSGQEVIVRFVNDKGGIIPSTISLRPNEVRSRSITCVAVETRPKDGGGWVLVCGRRPHPTAVVKGGDSEEVAPDAPPVLTEHAAGDDAPVGDNRTVLAPRRSVQECPSVVLHPARPVEEEAVDDYQRHTDHASLTDEDYPDRQRDDWQEADVTNTSGWSVHSWRLVAVCVGPAVLLLVVVTWFLRAGRTGRRSRRPSAVSTPSGDAPAIIVRRKTTSILRKQTLEDVIGNDAYFAIDSNEFCDDSTVRRIYFKNTCVKDIYNLYAEDLRNPDNPKEDGCLVLGRWVYDGEHKEYYVSLEAIVRPGDDAVLSEYELNFGGKIKLKEREALRKLRRDTNLQYDLTCWVHSHPGLGVFFSNADCGVQMQFKNVTHPGFLTAVVVDILTPLQELGIFTFKHDGTMNSKADLKKMYSLEALYQWAVKSERKLFRCDDCYDTLAHSGAHTDCCHGIFLTNGAIIDMGLLVGEQSPGFVGKLYGYEHRSAAGSEYVVTSVGGSGGTDTDAVGCFVVATHCSIPAVRRIVGGSLAMVRFVLVYTTTDGLLTSIPVVGQDLCMDEKYDGEQTLEELKIWTRRRR